MKYIPFFKTTTDEQELLHIQEALEGTNKILELENAVKDFIDCKYAISTNNGTSAMHLALSAIDLKRGDKILMSVNSFVNVPEVVRHFDAEPIFIDIDDSMNIDLDKLEEYLKNNKSKKLRGAIISFMAGKTCNLDRLYEIKEKYNIILIEDATNALGVTYKNEIVGALKSDITIFSIIPSTSKYSISNAGIITTNDINIADRAELLRTHSLVSKFDNLGNLDYIYDVVDIGYKYDLTELDAAFNLSQLNKTNKFIKRRKDIAKMYINKLSNLKHIKVDKYDNEHIYTQFIIKIDKNRDSFAKKLKEKGISTGLNYIPLHLLSYYKQKYNIKITKYPKALNNYQQMLSLPIYPSLTDNEVEYIIQEIIKLDNEWI